MRFRGAFVTTAPMKATHSNKRSTTQNSNRLAAYLATGIGAGLVATPVAEAAIVTIDITTNGFGIDGPNAGLSNDMRDIFNFPISGSGTLSIYSDSTGSGFASGSNFFIASGNSVASPTKFSQNQSIGSSANWVNDLGGMAFFNSFFKLSFMSYNEESPDFGSGSFLGFKTAQGNYGWLEVTWAGATDTFQIYSGAYESVANVAILAGDTGTSAVPEPGQVASSLLVLALGAAGVAIQRQRAKKKQQAEAVSLS
jgi:hypothetical protein